MGRSDWLVAAVFSAGVYAARVPPEEDAAHGDGARPSTLGGSRRLARWRRAFARLVAPHTDSILLALLAYKVLLLGVFTMPQSWFFGVKERALRWASRSPFLQAYLGSAAVPLGGLAIYLTLRRSALDGSGGGAGPARGASPAALLRLQRQQTMSATNLLLTLVTGRLYELVKGDAEPLLQLEREAEDRACINFVPPALSVLGALLAPLRALCPPVLSGLENIPRRPGLARLATESSPLWRVDLHAPRGRTARTRRRKAAQASSDAAAAGARAVAAAAGEASEEAVAAAAFALAAKDSASAHALYMRALDWDEAAEGAAAGGGGAAVPAPGSGDHQLGQRLLFVGNHLMWALDSPLLLYALYEQTGIWCRPLGEHAWLAVPGLGGLVSAFGVIDGTPHNCDLLMERGANLLVYPGGVREAFKTKGEDKYAVQWGKNLGFARMALKHGYTIVPVASVGLADAFPHLADFPLGKALSLLDAGGDDPAAATPAGPGEKGTPPDMSQKPASKLLEGDTTVPVFAPPLPCTAQRSYFHFGRPVDATHFDGPEAVRDATKAELTKAVAWLQEHRKSDPLRYVVPFMAPKSAVAPGAGNNSSSSSRL